MPQSKRIDLQNMRRFFFVINMCATASTSTSVTRCVWIKFRFPSRTEDIVLLYAVFNHLIPEAARSASHDPRGETQPINSSFLMLGSVFVRHFQSIYKTVWRIRDFICFLAIYPLLLLFWIFCSFIDLVAMFHKCLLFFVLPLYFHLIFITLLAFLDFLLPHVVPSFEFTFQVNSVIDEFILEFLNQYGCR